MQPMEIRPPFETVVSKPLFYASTERNDTHDVVVLAANRLLRARGATAEANNAERGALETDQARDVLQVEAQEA